MCFALQEIVRSGVAGRLVRADASDDSFYIGVFIMIQSIAAKLIGRFIRDQRGATMVEYGLLVALVAVAVLVAVTSLGGAIGSIFQTASDDLSGAGDAP
jgi:pilus assembly protein Flp/PilA